MRMLTYRSRGKTVWKSHGDHQALEPDDGGGAVGAEGGRVTRSSIKPRLLFPSLNRGKKEVRGNTEDEEATTDVEVQDEPESDGIGGEQVAETPAEDMSLPPTPAAPRFAPASPPTTARVTRSKKALDDTPIQYAGKAPSPFDAWRRSKSASARPDQKRSAAPAPASRGTKRQRT
jgi:hypothetical protein